MAKLYELAQSYRLLAEQLEDNDFDQETILATLEGSDELMSIEEKAGNIVRMVKNWESDIPGLDSEIKRLQARKKAIENRVTSIKTYLQGSMEAAGIDKLKIDTFTIALQNNPPAVIVHDLTQIPAEFMTIIPEQHVPDKTRIKAAIKDGNEVPGVTLQQGKGLRIR